MIHYVVMITGPTETPSLLGPFRKHDRAKQAADQWNKANPPDPDDAEPYKALVWPVKPFRVDA